MFSQYLLSDIGRSLRHGPAPLQPGGQGLRSHPRYHRTHDGEEFNGMFGRSVAECWLVGNVVGMQEVCPDCCRLEGSCWTTSTWASSTPARTASRPPKSTSSRSSRRSAAPYVHTRHTTHDTQRTTHDTRHTTHDMTLTRVHTHTHTHTENGGDFPERLPERPGLRRRRRRGPLAHPRPASHPTAPRYLWYPPATHDTHARQGRV